MHTCYQHAPLRNSSSQAPATIRNTMASAYEHPALNHADAHAAWETKMKELNQHWHPSRGELAEEDFA